MTTASPHQIQRNPGDRLHRPLEWRTSLGTVNRTIVVRELCALLQLEVPHPSAEKNYMFERPVTFRHGNGTDTPGRIDCYRQGAFVLEAKKFYKRPARVLTSGEPLTAKEKIIHGEGLVSVLKSLHDELDAAVLAAYGWSDLARSIGSDQQAASASLLQRLVTLNAVRAAEEAGGTIRWLRPAFQNPSLPSAAAALPEQQQSSMALEDGYQPAAAVSIGATKAAAWPLALPEQVRAVAAALAAAPLGLPLTAIAAQFKGKGQWKKDLLPILETLAALSRARNSGGLWHSA